MKERSGIGLVGSVIVDVVYEILEPGNLVYSDGDRYLKGDDYESEKIEYTVGGLCTNNSLNLAKMGVPYPIRVMGKIGADENGKRIRSTLRKNGISDEFLIETTEHPTSTTHVLYINDSSGIINRAFRYYFGAMGSFCPEDIDYSMLEDMKIVIVGYCLLMPIFDTVDPEYGAVIGGVLKKVRSMGIQTCTDFVSLKSDKAWKYKRFRKTLKWVDILSIGEDQAECITGISDEKTAAKSLVEDYGAKTAVVHCGDKGFNYLYSASTGLIIQPNFKVPSDEYAGNVGAGDAFTSGFLHGIHQDWGEAKALKYAAAAAAVSLGSFTSTGAMQKEEYIIEYMNTRPVVK